MATAARRWAERVVAAHQDVVAVGWFGSYARDEAGFGSDVDLVIVVRESDEAFERRAVRFDATDLPVPADLLVYTQAEWRRLARSEGSKKLTASVVWLAGGSTSGP